MNVDVVRKHWNWTGVIESDCGAISGIQSHGNAKDQQGAAVAAVTATVGMECDGAYKAKLAQAVQAIDKIESVVKLVVLGSSQELTIEPKSATNKAPLGVSLTAHEDKGGAGVKVASVRPDGRAAQAGITAGDSLLSINGQLCIDHKQAVGLLDAVAAGAYIKAVVLSKYDGLQ